MEVQELPRDVELDDEPDPAVRSRAVSVTGESCVGCSHGAMNGMFCRSVVAEACTVAADALHGAAAMHKLSSE